MSVVAAHLMCLFKRSNGFISKRAMQSLVSVFGDGANALEMQKQRLGGDFRFGVSPMGLMILRLVVALLGVTMS